MTPLRAIRYAAWAAVAAALAIFGTVAWLQYAGDGRFAAASIGGPFSLTDQHGTAVTEVAFKGHPTALFFGYTFCPDVCPTTLFEMTGWLNQLGPEADKLKVYFVTVDPERDTQAVLASYLSAFDPRITGLTGSPEAIEKMIKAYRIYARKVPLDGGGYVMDHTASVYLLNADAVFTGTIDYQEAPDTALAKLRRLIESS